MIADLRSSILPSTLAIGFLYSQSLLGPDRRDDNLRVTLLCRIRSEFSEMPCLRLTEAQSARLFGLRPDVCWRVMATLMTEGFLWRGNDGRYVMRRRH